MAPLLLLLFLLASSEAANIVGVNYGRIASNLPPPSAVARLLQSQGIYHIKLFDADPSVLLALSNTSAVVTVALPNELLASAAADPSFTLSWVQRSILPFHPSTNISAVAVGNEVFSSPGNLSSLLVPAMQNLHSALVRFNLDAAIKISSPIALAALDSSFPPSSGSFQPDLIETAIKPMLDLLSTTGSYLMINAYPFFAYEANSNVISLDYALSQKNPGVVDAGTGLTYYSLLDAQVDAVVAAMKAVGHGDLRVVVSETGWPSKGDDDETGAGEGNAAAYNGNLVRRMMAGNGGTPMRPDAGMDVYLFALFNEDQKTGPTSEKNYGLFYPDERKVYDVQFAKNQPNNGIWN